MSGKRDKLNRQLEEAFSQRDVGEIERLVKQERADVNCRDSDGEPLIYIATWNNSHDVVKVLLELGCDVNATELVSGWTSLMLAAYRGYDSIVETLIGHEANVNLKHEIDGSTALHLAAFNNHASTVQLFLQAGADQDATDDRGETALQLAKRRNKQTAVEAFRKFNAERRTEQQHSQLSTASSKPAQQQMRTRSRQQPQRETASQLSVSEDVPTLEHLHLSGATQARRQIQAVSATRTGARPVHDEELVRELLQQVEGLVQEQARKDEQLENLQRSLNDKDALLREENQRVISLERSSNVNDALLQEANQRVISLERSSNDKDALLRVANQRDEGLQRSLNGLQTQLQEANQSLNVKDAQLLEANRRAASLQSDLERQERDTQSLQQDVRDMRFLLSDAETRIAEGRQGIQESDVLRIASRDIHLTDNKLGHGSYGEVCIAYWQSCPVAVKVLYEELAAYQRNIDLLLQEVNIAWKIHHPNVAAVCGVTLELTDEKNTAWIIMELLQGSMCGVIDASRRQDVGALTLRERVDMAHDSLCGLHYLHSLPRTVLHGDIRPTNILVTAVMGAKLGDLGAARFGDASLSAGLLSPEYTATERMDGRVTQKSKETDIYSMGVTICELFTAATPSRVKRRDQLYLVKQLGVRSECMRMVSDDPSTRPSAGDALAAIDRLRATDEYNGCPPRRMVKGKIDGVPDVTLVQHM